MGDSQPGSPNPEVTVTEERDGSPDSSLAFKCHLCEASFGDRGGALRHLASSHATEYEQLVSKGALDATSDRSESADDDDRGKFPDHANRKVSTMSISISCHLVPGTGIFSFYNKTQILQKISTSFGCKITSKVCH